VQDQAPVRALAGRHFVVVLVDLHAQTFHRLPRIVGAQVCASSNGSTVKLAALAAQADGAHVAYLVVGVGVPGRVGMRQLRSDYTLLSCQRIWDIVEQEEFSFRTIYATSPMPEDFR